MSETSITQLAAIPAKGQPESAANGAEPPPTPTGTPPPALPVELDIFRDTWVRYFGYANEVGEAFRPLVHPRYVRSSYGIAFAYVLADSSTKFLDARTAETKRVEAAAMATAKQSNASTAVFDRVAVAKVGVDTLIWQTFASVLIPGKIIHFLTNGSKLVIDTFGHHVKWNPLVKRLSPTAIGLISIPVIIEPIDHFVDYAMDNTIRKWWSK